MVNCLEFDAELQAELDEFAARPENEDTSWLELSQAFANHLEELGRLECPPEVHNTYNDSDRIHLTQCLQYVTLAIDDGGDGYPTHLIVHVHGGCDVRGGYTAPKCFRLTDEIYNCLDKAHINGLAAGDNTWWIEDPTLRPNSLEPHHANALGIADPLELPLYTEDYLIELMEQAGLDPSEIQAIQGAITACKGLVGAVKAGATPLTSPTLQAETTLAELDRRIKELRDELETELVKGVWLLSQHALLLMDDDHRLLLVDGDNETAEELEAFSDL